MSSEDTEVQVALLEIAKDLLEASDALAATDPEAAAKLAKEAYEIAKDLGIVKRNLAPSPDEVVLGEANEASSADEALQSRPGKPPAAIGLHGQDGFAGPHLDQSIEEESDMDLFRILDRQREILPSASPNFSLSRRSRRPSDHGRAKPDRQQRPWWRSWVRRDETERVG